MKHNVVVVILIPVGYPTTCEWRVRRENERMKEDAPTQHTQTLAIYKQFPIRGQQEEKKKNYLKVATRKGSEKKGEIDVEGRE
jgi:hypothetical protein